MDNAIEILGSDHLMFGSNFPVEKLWTSHSALLSAYQDAMAKYAEGQRTDVFWKVAYRVFRLT